MNETDQNWNRCDYCGQYIPIRHFTIGKARRILLTPDSEFTQEEYETICTKCMGRIEKALS